MSRGQHTGEFPRTGGLDAAMSFEEIGRELGITKGGAWMLYKSAIRKLRRHRPQQLQKLRELAQSKARVRHG